MKLEFTIGAVGKDCAVKTEDGEPLDGAVGFDVVAQVGKATKVNLELLASQTLLTIKGSDEPAEVPREEEPDTPESRRRLMLHCLADHLGERIKLTYQNKGTIEQHVEGRLFAIQATEEGEACKRVRWVQLKECGKHLPERLINFKLVTEIKLPDVGPPIFHM